MSLRQDVSKKSVGEEQNGNFTIIRPRIMLAAFVGVLALGLSACSSDAASTGVAAAGADGATVTIEDMAFAPETLTVSAGGPASARCPSRFRSDPRGRHGRHC